MTEQRGDILEEIDYCLSKGVYDEANPIASETNLTELLTNAVLEIQELREQVRNLYAEIDELVNKESI